MVEKSRPAAPWALDMWWLDVCFLHWRADPKILSRALPNGVEIDRFNGEAWLSVVPFRMANIRLRGAPSCPGFTSVPEINLRTYVRVGRRPGIWFFSLDAASRAVVRSARIATALPYFDARIATAQTAGTIEYASERIGSDKTEGRFIARYTPKGEPLVAAAGTLEAFLHERYRFFARRGSRFLTAEVRHEPWAIQAASVEIATNTLGTIVTHPLDREPELVAFSRGLRVRATLTGPA